MTGPREEHTAAGVAEDIEPRGAVADGLWPEDGADPVSDDAGDDPTPSLRPRGAVPFAAGPAPPAPGRAEWRAAALTVAVAAVVAPAVGLVAGDVSFEHLFIAVIVALVVERALAALALTHERTLVERRIAFEAQVRERTAELELANIALRHEIEERNEIQEQLVDAERLAVAGGVAAGVCHEIRNPLAALMGNIELAAEHLGAADEARTLLVAAMEGARQVEAVTGDLQTLARPGPDVGGVADLPLAVDAALRLAMPYLRAQCALEIAVAPARVGLAQSRLVQLLLNLLINAAKATRPDEQNVVRICTVPSDEGFVALEVQDSGIGMDAAVQRRVFEPFFTTRRQQGGSGLGLYLSRMIARACGGSLTFRSIPGAGTTFRLTLPVIG